MTAPAADAFEEALRGRGLQARARTQAAALPRVRLTRCAAAVRCAQAVDASGTELEGLRYVASMRPGPATVFVTQARRGCSAAQHRAFGRAC